MYPKARKYTAKHGCNKIANRAKILLLLLLFLKMLEVHYKTITNIITECDLPGAVRIGV